MTIDSSSSVSASNSLSNGNDTLSHTDDDTSSSSSSSVTYPHAKEIFAIRRHIRETDTALRQRFPLFAYQNTLGLLLWLGSFLWIGILTYLYFTHYPSYYLLPIAAVPYSILHELEHDLIHNLYFRTQPIAQDIMFLGIWIAKLSLSPWVRRDLHLLHHKRSGLIDDVEERLLGLGMSSFFLRILTAVCPPVGLFYVRQIQKDTPWRLLRGTKCSKERWLQRIDLVFIVSPLIITYLTYRGYEWARTMFILWIGPNVLRHACLALLSSYSHYYGDIVPGDIMQQNQILNSWWVFPFQWFACNFGAEHIIHHFVVDQPFYIRHMVRYQAWYIMKQYGIRENDFGIVQRANRYGEYHKPVIKNGKAV